METTNLSRIRREKMLHTINEIKKNALDEETLNNLSLIENELTKKKYGLIWEEHEERVDKELETQIPTFEDIKSKQVKLNDGKFNFLLEGDNLHSLYLLEKTHKNKIDVIYIDPPYNTGSKDFIYNDVYVDSDDGYKHSKWLSFMEKRLKIAKDLLTNRGVLFISIDDNELYQLKLLCDDIFGDNNFVANIVVESGGAFGAKTSHKDKTIFKVKDYVLVYTKDNNCNCKRQPLYDKANEPFDPRYNFFIENNKKMPLIDYFRSNETIIKEFQKFNLTVDKKNISKLMLINDDFNDMMLNKISKNIFKDSQFTLNIPKEIIEEFKTKDIVEYKKYMLMKTQNGNIRHLQSFYDVLTQNDECVSEFSRSVLRGDLWKNFVKDMGNVAKEGNIEFKNGKKPIRLIMQLIKWANIEDATILDFFAGSGSTAHAVLELNKIDKGNRKFIICTNNENNICEEVTYKRLKNLKKEYNYNLKYYKTSYIPRINTDEENLSKNLMVNIKNLIQLENGIEIDDKIVRVILSEEEIDKFTINDKELDECEKLYISSDILLTSKQSKIFNDYNIELFIIPEYYFEDEIREVA